MRYVICYTNNSKSLSDFKASGALTYFSYAWLWFLALVAVAVYASDTFTAVNLLAYDKWSSRIEPAIPLKYSKWIFAVCIIISWLLCIFEWVRAIRIIRRDSVADSYMDSVAITLQSIRPQGWKRFLVFAELTKSKKGVDYVALFVYFQFKGAIRILLAEAPRQVVNGITLYSVMQADIIPTGDHAATSGHSAIQQFFLNIETLADTNKEQAVVLFTMMFTLFIWVISALSLLIAVILYLVFLWHYIPEKDGRLSVYCRRKVDRRLGKIVSAKVKQALEDQEKKRTREETKSGKKTERPGIPTRQATLPQLAGTTPRIDDDKLPDFKLARQDSEATLLSSHSQPSLRNGEKPGISRQATLPDVRPSNARPGMPSRTGTEASAFSNVSYESDAPLLGNATEMGYAEDRHGYMNQSRPVLDRQTSASSYGSRPPVFERQMSNSSFVPGQRPPVDRQMSASSNGSRPILDRQMSASSYGRQPIERQMSNTPYDRQMSATPYDSRQPVDRQMSTSSYGFRPLVDRQMSASSYGPRPPLTRVMTPLTEVSSAPSDSVAHEEIMNTPSYEMDSYHAPPPPQRPSTAFNPRQESLMRQGTYSSMPVPDNIPFQPTGTQNFNRPFSPPVRPSTTTPYANRYNPSPAPQAFEMTSRPPLAVLPPSDSSLAPANSGYVAFNPSYSAPQYAPPRRVMTNPPAGADFHPIPQRSATAPPEAVAYEELIDEYRYRNHHADAEGSARSATAGPGGHERW